jgi:hypothetical protein
VTRRQRQRRLAGATKPLQNLAAESSRLAQLSETLDAREADGPRDRERHSLVTDVVELPRRIHHAPDDALDRVVGEDAVGDVGRVEAAAGVFGRSDWLWGLCKVLTKVEAR